MPPHEETAMPRRFWRPSLVPATHILLALSLIALAAPARAADDPNAEPPRVLTITGTGAASAPPDIAYVETGVVTQADTAADALAANTKAMDGMFKGLEDMGVAKQDMQTSQFSVNPVYNQPKDSDQAPQIRAYQVTNRVTVTIRKLDTLGATLDKLVGLGSNRLDNVNFAIEHPEPLLDKARAAAVANALHKAKLYADAAGVTLGPILSIAEGGGIVQPPRPLMRMTAAEAAVPVASGEQKLTSNVTVVFALK
jgi:uncharacterized protein YggE